MTKTAKRFSLDGTQLKLLALIFMLSDHVYYIFSFTKVVPVILTIIGRLSAYLFLFCMVEGFSHTHSKQRYFLRVYILAAGMGFIYHLMSYHHLFVRPDGFFPENGILLNLVVLCIIWKGIDCMKEKQPVKGTILIFLPFYYMTIAEQLHTIPSLTHAISLLDYTLLPNLGRFTDGGLPYIVIGIFLYLFKDNRKLQILSFIITVLLMQIGFRGLMYAQNIPGFHWSMFFTNAEYCHWLCVFSAAFMFLYNGKRGHGFKSLFYWFYPAHIYLLYAFSFLCF